MRLSGKTIHGRTVISADGQVVGTIEELFLTGPEWRIESILIELNKDVADRIGASRTILRHATLELPIAFVQSVGDTVVLSVNVDQLREVHRADGATPSPRPSP
ncbi:MAG TPA: PRC-barrel domain-containing protein [Kofleriaceae bacterium]|jgi:sporulation protein YlmC with PRC-barrel domain|nr:PRC-barrel domain-containing protein [Kofleriaceae bacterium]